MTKLDDREYVRGELPIEVDDASSTGKHAGEGTEKKTTTLWLSFFGVVMGALSFALYKQANKAMEFAPNDDGSFPLFKGTWNVFPIAAILGAVALGAVLIACAASNKHFAAKATVSSLAVFFGIVFLCGQINANAHMAWKDSMKSWVSNTYDLEYDYITAYHYPGVVGKSATKYTPAIYIDPPENIKYLTTKEGQYVAELIPDVYGGDSVRVYEISNEPTPPLMKVKNSPEIPKAEQ